MRRVIVAAVAALWCGATVAAAQGAIENLDAAVYRTAQAAAYVILCPRLMYGPSVTAAIPADIRERMVLGRYVIAYEANVDKVVAERAGRPSNENCAEALRLFGPAGVLLPGWVAERPEASARLTVYAMLGLVVPRNPPADAEALGRATYLREKCLQAEFDSGVLGVLLRKWGSSVADFEIGGGYFGEFMSGMESVRRDVPASADACRHAWSEFGPNGYRLPGVLKF